MLMPAALRHGHAAATLRQTRCRRRLIAACCRCYQLLLPHAADATLDAKASSRRVAAMPVRATPIAVLIAATYAC